jgi:hypothetical protein
MRCVIINPRGKGEDRVLCESCGKSIGAVSIKRCPPLVLSCEGCGVDLH